jgi:hypothetical protein
MNRFLVFVSILVCVPLCALAGTSTPDKLSYKITNEDIQSALTHQTPSPSETKISGKIKNINYQVISALNSKKITKNQVNKLNRETIQIRHQEVEYFQKNKSVALTTDQENKLNTKFNKIADELNVDIHSSSVTSNDTSPNPTPTDQK